MLTEKSWSVWTYSSKTSLRHSSCITFIMEPVLDLSSLPHPTPTVTYDLKSETVTFPAAVVSVAGVTAITGGIELSWGSCFLAFGFWGTLVGLSALCVGLMGFTLTLLALGFVILFLSLGTMIGVFALHYIKKKARMTRRERKEGNVVLVGGEGENVLKILTI